MVSATYGHQRRGKVHRLDWNELRITIKVACSSGSLKSLLVDLI